MRDVKTFSSSRVDIPPLSKRLKELGIPVYKEVTDCDIAVVLFGAYENPEAFEHKTLVYWMHNDNQFWTLGFHTFYLPILRHYYDEFLDCSKCESYEEIAEKVAEYIREKQHAVD